MTQPLPSDHATRERFINSPDENFSVIAPAGVGKTKAIVDRIVAIATSVDAQEFLPRLVVVTYTKKAADEMQQRTRNAIIERKVDLATLTQFNRAFFGTIHSFCVRIIRNHGHHLGLPAAFDSAENDDELWAAFLRQLDEIAPGFPVAGKQQCLRFQSLEKILKLARAVRREHEPFATIPSGECPLPRLDTLLAYEPKGSAKKTVARTQDALRRWRDQVAAAAPYIPPPQSSSKAKEFVELWQTAFAPFESWLNETSWALAVEVAKAYRAYRLAQGCLTYDDQIALAYDLVREPRAAKQLRAEKFHVILDEAQDTDPTQFNVLLELARPEKAKGIWLETGGDPPAPGRFCMVGDPQQSIYSSRADLAHYAAIRKKLLDANAATEINFDVTFRCDRAIIDSVNILAAPMLDGESGQAEFYELQERPHAGPGQVIRIEMEPPPPREDEKKHAVGEVALHEARQLADWIVTQGLEKFGANVWSDVALLCPRRDWLATMQQALFEKGLVPQVHSDNTIRGDSAAFAWFTALVTIMDAPNNTFEIAGVLREIYGLSDDALARFTQGDGTKLAIASLAPSTVSIALQLTSPSPRLRGEGRGEGSSSASVPSVSSVVKSLSALRAELINLPLRDAMQLLVDRTALRERVAIIDEPTDEIDGLLALASIAESRGDSIATFAETLREEFEKEVQAKPVQENAVQLITCHKAKGLQWEAVILPMLFRQISTKSDYPAILNAGPGHAPRVAFSSADVGDLGAVLDLKRRHEHQRLLYVALTRSKKSLVLVDDRKLFPCKKPNDSFADLLGLLDTDGKVIFNEHWENLPQKLIAPTRDEKPTADMIELDIPALDADALARAQQISADIPVRILPYALAETQHELEREERRDEVPAAAAVENSPDAESARLYGIWWHELMESMNWQGRDAEREEAAKRKLETCPQPERGAREWNLLRESKLMSGLVTSDAVVHSEMPFQYTRSKREWMEGVMDLVIFYPSEDSLLILDWKTNLITPAEVESLRSLYAPQLDAYAEALRAITKLPVTAGIYSTSTGIWVPMG